MHACARYFFYVGASTSTLSTTTFPFPLPNRARAMSIQRSPNCAAYTDHVSVLVDAKATVPGDEERCTVPLPPVFSCQASRFEAPDEATRAAMLAGAAEALTARGCDPDRAALVDVATNMVGAQQTDYSGEKLARLGMASNCFAHGNDPNDSTHTATARCRNMYDMTDADGQRVRNYHKVFSASLATCDVSDEAWPQLTEDLRKVAARNAAANGFTIDHADNLACDFASLPHL